MIGKKTDDFKHRYEQAKKKLATDDRVILENRHFFLEFLDYQENKLKRVNGLRSLDQSTYKTLYLYIVRFKNVDRWFSKPLKDITKADIERVYNDLEDGKIKSQRGTPVANPQDYYSKIFKSKPFQMLGKDNLAREVIEYRSPNKQEVRFVTEEDFRQMLDYAPTPKKKLLLWLAWDIGENINSLLRLEKKDFYKETNPHTKEAEYRVNLRKEILKRTRKPRSELTNYPETVKLLDQILATLKHDNELLFDFDYATAKKIFTRIAEKTEIKAKPINDRPTWKDLRSGMACHLLKTGWTTDEVNARLGHKPSSQEIDKYVNFLAIDRRTPKKKVHQFELEKIQSELDEVKSREKHKQRELEHLKQEFEEQLKAQRQEMLKLILKVNPEIISDPKLKALVKKRK